MSNKYCYFIFSILQNRTNKLEISIKQWVNNADAKTTSGTTIEAILNSGLIFNDVGQKQLKLFKNMLCVEIKNIWGNM